MTNKAINNSSEENSVCIQFSGGSDSSLTAFKASNYYDKVYLLTFRHFGHVDIENSRKSFEVLNQFRPEKFIHQIIDIDDMFEEIYHRNYFKKLKKYRTLLLQLTCFACQVSFIVNTIKFCKKNNIYHVNDGANTEYEETSPMQIRAVNKRIKQFYKHYGITHESPVYDEHESYRSDRQLYDLGLREKENIKDDTVLYKKYQGYCKFMPGSTVFLKYRKKCRKYPEDVQEMILKHWNEELNYIKSIVDREL